MAKANMTAIEHNPPLADLNSGFYLYLSSSMVLNKSQIVINYFVFFKILLTTICCEFGILLNNESNQYKLYLNFKRLQIIVIDRRISLYEIKMFEVILFKIKV